MNAKPASTVVQPVNIVHLLAKHPGLRDSFPWAAAVDASVREGA